MTTTIRPYAYPVLLALAIYAASSASRLATPDLGFTVSYDKVAHFFVFGLVATSILRIPKLVNKGFRGALIAAIITSIYGACDEFRQSLTPGRSVEFADWVFDTLGAVVAVVAYRKWKLYRDVLESKCPARSRKNRGNVTH
ncbi:MAG TPA: hypothetical protein DCX06_12830 [Opitutae bacterium]|nr:hypothetical protein [Opitutae bacterium]